MNDFRSNRNHLTANQGQLTTAPKSRRNEKRQSAKDANHANEQHALQRFRNKWRRNRISETVDTLRRTTIGSACRANLIMGQTLAGDLHSAGEIKASAGEQEEEEEVEQEQEVEMEAETTFNLVPVLAATGSSTADELFPGVDRF